MMTFMLVMGLTLGIAAITPAASVDHATRLDHHSGSVDARYRGDVTVRHQQVGSVGPGGRQSTLRCAWTGNLTVARAAKAASGATMTRIVTREGVVAGSHVGWCGTHDKSIAKQIAARRGEMERHIQAVAQEDRAVLHAELDRFHANANVG